MKVAPVSGDLLVKLALVAVGAGVLWYVGRQAVAKVEAWNPLGQASDAIGGAWAAATEVLYATADKVNPASTNNVVYAGINRLFWPDGSENLGGALHDWWNGDAGYADVVESPSAWKTYGKWNNPSAWEPPTTHTFMTEGQGGAAFGIYPRP